MENDIFRKFYINNVINTRVDPKHDIDSQFKTIGKALQARDGLI